MNTASPNTLGRALRRFFTDHLPRVRGASSHTIQSYRDAFVLLLRFVAAQRGAPVSELNLSHLGPREVLEILSGVSRPIVQKMVVKAEVLFHRMVLRSIYNSTLIFALATFAGTLSAKDKDPKPPAQDEIQVIAHIPFTGEQVARFLTTQHYRNYLYAEKESGKTVTLIDITNISHPAVIAELSDPSGSADNLVAVTGSAALVSVANKQSNGDL